MKTIAHNDLTRKGGLNNDARVANLNDPGTKGWKINMIRALFKMDNGNVICQIPIGFNHRSDKQI
jgi:hypothetical protein